MKAPRKPADFDGKLEHSIELPRKSERLALRYSDKGFYLAFSGGKDSQALYHVARLAGVKFEAHYNMTTLDPPEVIRSIRTRYPDVINDRPEMTFAHLCLKKKALPTMQVRFCCAVLKETRGEGTVTLTGVRRQESTRRAKRNEAETIGDKKHRFSGTFEQLDQFTRSKEMEGVQCINGNDKIVINPIITWTEADVWYFLNEVVRVEHCELYDRGWKRIGCLFCPMANKREIIRQGGGVPKISGFNAPHHTPFKRKRLHEPIHRLGGRRGVCVVDFKARHTHLVRRKQVTARLIQRQSDIRVMTIERNNIYNMDCLQGLRQMPDNSVDCCVTSPPYYGLRDYGVDGQIGLEESPTAYIERLTEVFAEVLRVLKKEGTLWLNLGDSYTGSGKGGASDPDNARKYKQGTSKGTLAKRTAYKYHTDCKPKDLIGIPWMAAFALRDKVGFYLRQDIIWAKPNVMPEPVTDRCTKSHEYIFLMSKSGRYYFDHEAIQERATGYDGRKDTVMHGSQKYAGRQIMPDGKPQSLASGGHPRWRFDGDKPVRNKRDVWNVPTRPDRNAHFATYPEELIRPGVLAGCPKGGTVLDPFMGSGTTARVAKHYGRNYVGFELNKGYFPIIQNKLQVAQDLFC